MNSHLKDNRRHNIITASQAWSAVYERQKLWREKTFREKPFSGNIMTQWGNDHEEVALRAFERHMNDICENGNKLIVNPDYPTIGASADAFLNGIPVEFIDWYIPKAKEFLSYVADDKEPPRYKRKPVFNFNKEKK